MLAVAVLLPACASSPIKRDEEIIFFPSLASRRLDGDGWDVRIHGWIFEPERDSPLRKFMLAEFERHLELHPGEPERERFWHRAWPFLADNERGKVIPVRFGPFVSLTRPSAPNGHFYGITRLTDAQVDEIRASQTRDDDWLSFAAAPPPGDPRIFTGEVLLLGETGVSVVSDIDDTIKITHVGDTKELLRNTFLREFTPVPGMSTLYSRWAAAGAAFHYVSASPWQLSVPLREFMDERGFPRGSMHLKTFRAKVGHALSLSDSQVAFKTETIEAILRVYPRREFILVGDSGEQDPEAYGALARHHPTQIVRILIHNVTGETADGPRFCEAMKGVPPDHWRLFSDAEQVDARLP